MPTKTRVRKCGSILGRDLWVVEIWSPVVNGWIIQGEHNTEEEAKADEASWN